MSDVLAYYPGCSLEGTAREYGESFEAVCEALNIALEELADWNCCGASSAHCTNSFLAGALPARNLRLAQEVERDIVAPCAACWTRLRAARNTVKSESRLGNRIALETGLNPAGRLPQVISAVAAITGTVGLEGLQKAGARTLKDTPLVTYYGCLNTRPVNVSEHPRPEDPEELDELVSALGGEVKPWSYKTDCCGGYLTLARPDVVTTLVDQLVGEAEAAGARAIVTSCPMCAANLDMRRSRAAPTIPVMYFTELIGYTLGLPQVGSWLGRHLVEARPVLNLVSHKSAAPGTGVSA